jgi:hypothetical protein
MLRRALIAVAFLLIAGGIGLRLGGMTAMGTVLALALVFERWRYRGSDGPGSNRWRRTEERFEDPESGQIMEVLYDPATGQRRYVKASAPQTGPATDTRGSR